MAPDNTFDGGKPPPIATVPDALRARIDAERFDGAVLWLEAVAADLGYGDVRPLPGAVAWIRELRGASKKVALAASGARARGAREGRGGPARRPRPLRRDRPRPAQCGHGRRGGDRARHRAGRRDPRRRR